MYPNVLHLQVLEGGQRICFHEDNILERLSHPPTTTLNSFFTLCQQDTFAKTLMYNQVPTYYTWNNKDRAWKWKVKGTRVPNVLGVRSTDTIGRIYTVHPNNSECFFLRLLLHTVIVSKILKLLVDNYVKRLETHVVSMICLRMMNIGIKAKWWFIP
eukprot:GHVR01181567.1.p1 GENE.GHVR01181567.1~~GHVR01181567.1.p1  ORF type:complete len:157 (-),score=4.38 GHVR01181567.1:130-600(-)